jgi:hypothetical protein
MIEQRNARTVLGTLKGGLAIISNPRRWGQDSFYLDRKGNEAYRDKACRVCALGALKLATNRVDTYLGAQKFLRQAVPATQPYMNIPCYNDASDRTHAEVVAWFKRAIKLAKAAQ